MTEWQPIESAPLDGSHVLLLTTSHGAVEAWFAPSSSWEHHEYGTQHEGAVWVCADDAFQIEVEECGPEHGGNHHGTATHWMPLPAPPDGSRS
jgi:hypothetical protein